MRTRRMVAASAVVAAAAVAVSIAGAQPPPAGLPQGGEPVTLDPASFTTKIDNPYLPLHPGSRWVYLATDPQGDRDRIVVSVLRRTRMVAGVRVRIVRDVDTDRKGRKVEDTRDWYAQDRDGNVWYFGENTLAYAHGRPASREGSWAAGVKGAQAGVAMPAHPVVGLAYRQEYSKGVAEDNGEVLRLGERVEGLKGRYRDVLVTRDTTSLDPYDVEYKYYAPGVGEVLASGVAGDADREDLLSYRR